MTEAIRRRFRDKIEGRSDPGRARAAGSAPPAAPSTAAAGLDAGETSLRVREIATGPFPAAASLSPAFPPGGPALRMTLDLDAGFLARMARPGGKARDRILTLCPGLLDQACGDTAALAGWLLEGGVDDGLGPVHLIGHAALDLAAAVAGPARRGSAACAWRDPEARFDLFFDGVVPALGRTLLLLAAAAVRDLTLPADRTPDHALARDVLARLAGGRRAWVVPEDLVPEPARDRDQAARAIDALARFGYLEPLPAALTFSSAAGVLYRIGAAPSAAGDASLAASGPRTFSVRSR